MCIRDRSKLRRHIVSHHSQDIQEEQGEKNSLKEEEKGQNSVCDLCGKACPSARSLREHMSRHSSDYPCTKCTKTFPMKSYLRKHIARRHTQEKEEKQKEIEEKGHACQICQKVCPSARSLREHMNSHSPEFACKECPKTYTMTRYLNDHINVVHKNVLKYNCILCGKIFGRNTSLGDHMTNRHKNTTNQIVSPSKWLIEHISEYLSLIHISEPTRPY